MKGIRFKVMDQSWESTTVAFYAGSCPCSPPGISSRGPVKLFTAQRFCVLFGSAFKISFQNQKQIALFPVEPRARARCLAATRAASSRAPGRATTRRRPKWPRRLAWTPAPPGAPYNRRARAPWRIGPILGPILWPGLPRGKACGAQKTRKRGKANGPQCTYVADLVAKVLVVSSELQVREVPNMFVYWIRAESAAPRDVQ